MTQLRKRHSLPLSMPAVVGEIFGSKMNPLPLPVIIFLIKRTSYFNQNGFNEIGPSFSKKNCQNKRENSPITTKKFIKKAQNIDEIGEIKSTREN